MQMERRNLAGASQMWVYKGVRSDPGMALSRMLSPSFDGNRRGLIPLTHNPFIMCSYVGMKNIAICFNNIVKNMYLSNMQLCECNG